MKTQTLRQLQVRNRRILYRAAYDVPLRPHGSGFVVEDDSRIRATIPTLRYLVERGCRIVILTWAGRPKSAKDTKYRLDPIARRLSQLMGQNVKKLDDCVGSKVDKAIAAMKPGEIVLLENVRFHREEERKDPVFMKALASHGDLCVFDAFAQAHRDVSSIVGPITHLPTVSGFSMEEELRTLSKMMQAPKRPFVAVIGGAKIEEKVGLLNELLRVADFVLLGGMSANTILQIKGVQVGKSRVSEEAANVARKIDLTNTKLKIPLDVVTATRIHSEAQTVLRAVGSVKANELLLDIGPDTVKMFSEIINKAKTVLWSGPMGYFELPVFAKGSIAIGKAIAKVSGDTIVGGGDTEAALTLAGVAGKVKFVSTGGGAMLEFLTGKTLPGLAYLKNS